MSRFLSIAKRAADNELLQDCCGFVVMAGFIIVTCWWIAGLGLAARSLP